MAVDYSWVKFAKPKDQKKKVEVVEKPKNTLKSKTKLKTKTPLKKSEKPINKKSENKEEVTEETYNAVLKRDKGKCRLCNTKKDLQLHHINGRGKGRTNNINNCIMLCDNCHNQVVHKENKKYRPILNEMIKKEVKK